MAGNKLGAGGTKAPSKGGKGVGDLGMPGTRRCGS